MTDGHFSIFCSLLALTLSERMERMQEIVRGDICSVTEKEDYGISKGDYCVTSVQTSDGGSGVGSTYCANECCGIWPLQFCCTVSTAEIGAIAGGAALTVVILIVCCCCIKRNIRARQVVAPSTQPAGTGDGQTVEQHGDRRQPTRQHQRRRLPTQATTALNSPAGNSPQQHVYRSPTFLQIIPVRPIRTSAGGTDAGRACMFGMSARGAGRGRMQGISLRSSPLAGIQTIPAPPASVSGPRRPRTNRTSTRNAMRAPGSLNLKENGEDSGRTLDSQTAGTSRQDDENWESSTQ